MLPHLVYVMLGIKPRALCMNQALYQLSYTPALDNRVLANLTKSNPADSPDGFRHTRRCLCKVSYKPGS